MLRRYFPDAVNRELFGDRKRFGKKAWEGDPDWEKWQSVYPDAYRLTQRSGSIQSQVNDAGYEVLRDVDLANRRVGEIGPGSGYHFRYFRGTPKLYHAFDVCADFFDDIAEQIPSSEIELICTKVCAYEPALPVEDSSLDVVLSFYSMEHLHPLSDWLDEIFRVLVPGGKLIGAIPTEGGLLWGLGRWLTSRRAVRREFGLDMRKIVCWEHPNTCDEVVAELAGRGASSARTWPWPFLGYDCNLLCKFIVTKAL